MTCQGSQSGTVALMPLMPAEPVVDMLEIGCHYRVHNQATIARRALKEQDPHGSVLRGGRVKIPAQPGCRITRLRELPDAFTSWSPQDCIKHGSALELNSDVTLKAGRVSPWRRLNPNEGTGRRGLDGDRLEKPRRGQKEHESGQDTSHRKPKSARGLHEATKALGT
jgi:hypothetical protein